MTEADNTQAGNVLLVVGFSTNGKSTSLKDIVNQDKWIYLNAESGKRLPFQSKFKEITITDPYDVHAYLQDVIDAPPGAVEGVIIDSVTFLMDMFETLYVKDSADSRAAWGDYAHFFKKMVYDYFPKITCPIIVLAHVRDELNEKEQETKTIIPVKGSLKNNGLEAFFTTIVSAKKKRLKDLDGYSSDLLDITEDEQIDGFKYVYQTRTTKGSTGERIRSPIGMFTREQTFIDNNAQAVIDHMTKYYE